MQEIVHISKPRGEILRELAPVKVIQILNPFRPATERKETVLECVPGELVSKTIERAGITLRQGAVTLNGGLLSEEDLRTAATKPGDWITVALGVGGGLWKSLAMMAVVAIASIVATPIAGALIGAGISAGIIGAGLTGALLTAAAPLLVSASILVGGSMLVSALSGLFQSNVSALNVTQTYNPEGPNTTAQPGGVIPKAYGVMGWGGNIISSFVNFDGTVNEYINILVAFGLGTAAAIENILVNGKPVFGYRELSTQVRLGTNDQTAIFGFNETVNGYPQDIEMLNADGPIVVPGTGTLTQALQVSVKFPGGLIRYDNNGNPKEVSFAYQLQYSVDNGSGDYDWQPVVAPRDVVAVTTVDTNGFVHYPYWVVMPTDKNAGNMIVYSTDTDEDAHTPGEFWQAQTDVKVYNVDNTNYTYPLTETGEWQPYDAANPLQLTLVNDWWSGWRIVSQMTTTPFYDNISILGLAPNKYAVQVTFWGAGPHNQSIPEGDVTDTHYTAQGWLWNINEVQYNDFSYPNMILVGLRCLATSQLSGQNMQIMATVTHDLGEDTQIPPELASFEHDNPAIVAFDIINNPLYGMGLPWSSVDIPAFLNWANFCDELVTNSLGTQQRRFVFAGVFDQASNAWACLQKVAQMSRAMIVRVGGMYSVALDAPSEPVQIFNVGNIKADSLEESWIGLDDRSNLVEVTFADALRNYRSDLPVSVIGAAEVNSPLPAKTTRVSLLGCTNRDQAWQWAYFQLLSTQTLLRMVTIKVPIEGVTCQMGSVIGIQHDVPQWGWGGRVQPGSTASAVVIDRDDLPAFEPGQGWTLSVQHPNLLRGTATVTGTSTNSEGESFVSLSAVPSGRILLMASQSGKTNAKVFALNAPALQNPNFSMGDVGWSLGTGWKVTGSGAGSGYGGSDSFGLFTGTGAAAMANLSQVPCAQGESYNVSCQIQGSAGATGSCFVQVKFYSATGTLLATENGNTVSANAKWQKSSVSATAPANAAYATIGAATTGVTKGTWAAGGFSPVVSGTLQVSALGDIAVGQTVELYDAHVIDNVLVAAVNGTTLSLETPLSQIPVPDSPWVYGQSQGFQPATLFRVTDLRQTGDFEITIKALEYNTLIYEDAIPQYGEVVGTPTSNASVSDLTLTENYQTPNPNNPTVSLISVGWKNGPNTVGALIYMRPADEYYPTLPTQNWRLLAKVEGTKYSFWAAQGTVVYVQVVGYDNLGNPAPQTTAPVSSITVNGPAGVAPAVSNFTIDSTTVPDPTQTAPGPTFDWTSVDGVSGYEIRFVPDTFGVAGGDWAVGQVMAQIAPAKAGGLAMTWQAPQNQFGTYYIASYFPASTVKSAPKQYLSSGYSAAFGCVYGSVQDWTPINFGGPLPPTFRTSGPIKVFDVASAASSAQSGVLLRNPNFEAGSAGWLCGAGWSIVAAGTNGFSTAYGGSPYYAHFSPGTAAQIVNIQKIPCAAGAVISAACFASGLAGANGTAQLRIFFFNAAGTYLGSAESAPATPGIGFAQSRAVGTAPANTSYAQVSFAVGNETAAAWAVGGFSSAIQPNSLAEVPDAAASNRYAATDPGSDQTVNRLGPTPFQFPSANVSVPANGKATLVTFTLQSTSPNDVFIFWGSFPLGQVPASAQLYFTIDGPNDEEFLAPPTASVAAFHGTLSGLKAGSHAISVVMTTGSQTLTVAKSTGSGIVLQAATNSGFINPPSGSQPVILPLAR